MYIYDFSFKNLFTKSLLIKFIVFHLENAPMKQKDILTELAVSPSTFFRSKKKGFQDNDIVLDELIRYYQIRKSDKTLGYELIDKICRLYTIKHFEKDTSCMYDYFKSVISRAEKTPSEILVLLGLCLAFNIEKNKEDIPFINENIDKLVDFKDSFDHNTNYLVLASLANYYINTNNTEMLYEVFDNLVKQLSKLDEALQVWANYLCMHISYIKKDSLTSLVYAYKCKDILRNYYSSYMIEDVRQLIINLNFEQENYAIVIDYAKIECLRLQFNDIEIKKYLCAMTHLGVSYLKNNNFNEAIHTFNCILNYKIERKNISEEEKAELRAHKVTINFYLLYTYLKASQYEDFDLLYKELKKNDYDFYPRNTLELLGILRNHSYSDMKQYSFILKQMDRKENKDKNYINLIHLFREEYMEYLVYKNKYIDLLDM